VFIRTISSLRGLDLYPSTVLLMDSRLMRSRISLLLFVMFLRIGLSLVLRFLVLRLLYVFSTLCGIGVGLGVIGGLCG